MQVRDPIAELHDTKLYQILLDIDTDYARRITTFVEVIAPLMAKIKIFFPYYTRHDAHHGYEVVCRMEDCLLPSCFDNTQPEALTAPEIFLLIAASYAHDLGMTVFPDEELTLTKKLGLTLDLGWETNELLQRHLRQNHSSRGGEYINQNADKLGVPRNLVAALDLLMKAHNYSIPQLESELDRPFATAQKESDLTQLAIIVCVADAIEFSDTRVIDGVLDSIGLDDSSNARISYAENMKHVCTGDSLAVTTNDGRIIVSGAFQDADVLALAHRTFDQMEEWILGYSDIDQRCKLRRLKVRGEAFQRDLIFTGGKFQRLGVRLNKRSVIDLIASNAVWRTNQGVALRELVQNAVEACRYRAHHSAPADKYTPEVHVIFDRGRNTVTVHDNGCGMSERTVLNNLLTVGSSRSKEAAYTESDYSPIARFGIGFWSVFTISDIATVSTAAFENYKGKPSEAINAHGFNFDVQLTDLKDFTVFSPLERPCGTSITLNLKKEVVIDDVYLALKRQLLCSIIPLKITLDGVEDTLNINVPSVSEDILYGVRHRAAKDAGLKIFQYRGETPLTELAFGLAYRLVDGRATFMMDSESSVLSIIDGFHKQRTAICGFSVPVRLEPLCIDFTRVGLYNSNARSPRGFEFSIDRQQLNHNPAMMQYVTDALKIFHDGYRAFLKETNSYRPEVIQLLQHEASQHGGNVYDTFTGQELAIAKENHPDLLCIKLIPVNLGIGIHEAEKNAIFLNLDELSNTTGLVFCLQNSRTSSRFGPTTYIDPESELALHIAIRYAQQHIVNERPNVPVYIALANRTLSMLFDSDPSAKAYTLTIKNDLEVVILGIHLEQVSYAQYPTEVIPNISGPWSGTLYWRDFLSTNGKPYLFLGRHRILIKVSSKLETHLRTFVSSQRFAALANFINLLKEDESGHTSPQLAGLL